jgi:superfamily I DNA/RNA helicase
MTAVLYRTNAQSRAIEDALMREGVAYRIIGGVRSTNGARSRTRSRICAC